jgi:fructokinase
VRVRRRADDGFPGICPFHGDCIEGLTSGPAIAARAGAPADTLAPDHHVWNDVAGELGELMAALVLTISPQRIVVGGGVGYGQRWLLPRVHDATLRALAGYVAAVDAETISSLIVPAGLGDDAGPLGSVALGLDALEHRG